MGYPEARGDRDATISGRRGRVTHVAHVRCRLLDDDREPVALGRRAFTLPKIQYESSPVSADCCTPAPQRGSLPVCDFLARALATTGERWITHCEASV